MLILISDAFDPGLPAVLKKYGEVTDDKARQAEADVVLIRSKTKVTKEYIDASPKLKLVIRGGVGLDNVDREYAKQKGIIVKNTPEASSIAVAELAFALMIALPNHLPLADASMHEGKWLKKELKRTELYGKTLGILGMGRIGTELGKRAKAFGMTVIAYDPFVKSHELATMVPSMKDLMQKSDYISMHMPLTDDTKGVINKTTLADCKNGAYIVNTGRGKCVIEEDMVEALKSGRIAGYATDVWYSDPPENSPLMGAPNVVMAPHIGAETKENLLRIGVIVDQIVGDFAKGKK
ncbi:MAG: hydroxyacid dehydrogenase [candidate division Zixibacteria bacterium]|nr:hydroxyacid dehydrogenase [candidate division Zixibacteria bacterium]